MGSVSLFFLLFLCRVVRKQVDLLRQILRHRRLVQQVIGTEGQPAGQQGFIYNPVIQAGGCLEQLLAGGGISVQIDCTMSMLGNFAPITVCGDLSGVGCTLEVFDVIADRENQLVGRKPFIYQFQRQCIGHLLDDQPCLFKWVWVLQDLPGDDALVFWFVCLNVRNGAGFPAPGMVDEQFRVDTKQFIEQFLVVIICRLPDRTPGNISHGVQAVGFQLGGIAFSHPPEVGERTVGPEGAAIAHLIQFCDADAVFIGGDMLRANVHGDLGQIQIRPNARRSSDTGRLQNVEDDFPGKFTGRQMVGLQVAGGVDEHLIDAVWVDVLRRHMLEVNTVDAGAPVNIVGHPGWSHDIVEGQGRISPYLRVVRGSAGELPARGIPLPLGIDLLDPLDHLKQPGSTGNAIRLQGRCDRQTDGLFSAAQVRHHEVGVQWIQPTLDALHTCVKRF